MKVLWFSVTKISSSTDWSKGLGWIGSLLEIVHKHSDIKLGVAYLTFDDEQEREELGISFIPIRIKRNNLKKCFIDTFTYNYIDFLTVEKSVEIVNKFQPDIIQIFGTEWCYGLLKEKINIPIVIHLQGSWPAYRNSQPYNFIIREIIYNFYNPVKLKRSIGQSFLYKKRADREEKIFRLNKYYMGRTCWDKALVHLYNPSARYYFCSEALRSDFINCNQKWTLKPSNKLHICSVTSNPLKGLDFVLKTAKLIKGNSNLDFEWNIIGCSDDLKKINEHYTGIKANEVNVISVGRLDSSKMVELYLNTDLYVHSAYIDNSPNAICEAQCLGLPIIATYVGGVPSLFSDEYPMEYLVPINDPYYLASKIIDFRKDEKTILRMSQLNYDIARERHSPENIYKSLLSIYKDIIETDKSIESK